MIKRLKNLWYRFRFRKNSRLLSVQSMVYAQLYVDGQLHSVGWYDSKDKVYDEMAKLIDELGGIHHARRVRADMSEAVMEVREGWGGRK